MKRDLENRIQSWVLGLLRYTKTLPRSLPNDIIAKQVIRSGTSVGANYVEAQGGSSKKDFTNFVHHAYKSARESLYWLELLQETQGNSVQVKSLIAELIELTKILGAILVKVKGRG